MIACLCSKQPGSQLQGLLTCCREMVFTQSRLRELVQAELPNSERASLVVLVNTRFSDVQQALEGVEEENAVSTLQAYQCQIAGELRASLSSQVVLLQLTSVLSCPYHPSTVEVQQYHAQLPVTTAATGSSTS